MTERLPLFVFGTLRTGECNHGLLVGRFERVIAARLDGYTHVDNPHGYWMIDEQEGANVEGEVFYLKEEIYDEVMVDLDDLEMLPPGEVIGEWYHRKTVTVVTGEGAITAWAYVKPIADQGDSRRT